MPREESREGITRRRVLQGMVAGSIVSLAGCNVSPEQTDTPRTSSPPATEPPTATVTQPPNDRTTGREGSADPAAPVATEPSVDVRGIPAVDRFDTVVNVANAGAAPDQSGSVTEVVERLAADDTALFFPGGRYRLEPVALDGLTNFALIGAPDRPPRFEPAVPGSDMPGAWIDVTGTSEFFLDGVDIDFTRDGYSGMTSISGAGGFQVRNLTVRGSFDVDGTAFRFGVRDPDAGAVVENLTVAGADEDGLDTNGVYVTREHAGAITFLDCRVENFSDNGIYASAPGGHGGRIQGRDGPVHVVGGLYRNNNIANVRLGSTGSTARNVTVVVDERPPRHPAGLNVRGIRLRGKRDQVVENCDVTYTEDAGTGDGAISIHEDNGRAYVRDTHIHMDRDEMNVIRAAPPAETTTGPTEPVFENVTISGSAGQRSVVNILGRDQTRIRNCCFQQSGPERNGIRFEDSDDCVVSGTTVSVTGQPIVRRRSDVMLNGNVLSAGSMCE